jgi:ABC-type antimicrobial peptide transport system permease subunit
MFGVTVRVLLRRRRELGIRLALGARPLRLIAGTLGATAAGASLGLAVGLALAAWAAPALSAYLHELTARDPGTFAASAALLFAASLIATAIPTVRSARMNVVEVLREE